ncbi:hypothetical protein ACJJTC_004514 [Scirpophaga incertulas]
MEEISRQSCNSLKILCLVVREGCGDISFIIAKVRLYIRSSYHHAITCKAHKVQPIAQYYTPYILGYGNPGLSSGKAGWTLYECVDCGNKYKHKGSLQRHIKYECRKQPSFKCPYCVYRAYQKHNLLLHERHLHKDLPEKVDFVSE